MSIQTGKSLIASCPECETKIRFDTVPALRQMVICPECSTELEVAQQSPLELDWAYADDDDDWDDDNDWDGDDDDEDWE